MAKSDITGVRRKIANKVSHSNIKTKRWQLPTSRSAASSCPSSAASCASCSRRATSAPIDRVGLVAYAAQHGLDVSRL
jgi:large subunit ribosomal protein L28